MNEILVFEARYMVSFCCVLRVCLFVWVARNLCMHRKREHNSGIVLQGKETEKVPPKMKR